MISCCSSRIRELFWVTVMLVVPFKSYEDSGTFINGLMGVTSRLKRDRVSASMWIWRPRGTVREV